jgi:hypothetical protein
MHRTRIVRAVCAVTTLSLLACEASPELTGDILAIGDSFLDYHTPDADIATVAGEALGLSVDRLAIGGTTMLGEDSIGETYVNGGHQLLIVSGGGNDLADCVCGESCDGVVDQLISANGTQGAISDVIDRALEDGMYVAWAGYMRPQPDADEFSQCGGELDLLRDRLEGRDAAEENMIFVDGSQIGTGVEDALYEPDGYHPSPKGCAEVGEALARYAEEAFDL